MKIAADGTFSGRRHGDPGRPSPARRSRRSTSSQARSRAAAAVEGTISATLEQAGGRAEKKTCRTGKVKFGARRPKGEIGKRGARPRARYYGTTAQRGVGPRRPIVLRVSGDGKLISRALFGEQVKCSDGTRSIGIEAPRTNIAIDSDGPRLRSRDGTRSTTATTFTYVDDRFTAVDRPQGREGHVLAQRPHGRQG